MKYNFPFNFFWGGFCFVLGSGGLKGERGDEKGSTKKKILLKTCRHRNMGSSGRLIDTSEDKYTSEDMDTPEGKDTSEDMDTPEGKDTSEDIDTPDDKDTSEDIDTPGDKDASEDIDSP